MNKVNQFAFYEFGAAFSQIRELKAGSEVADLILAVWSAEQAILKFLVESRHVSLRLSTLSLQKLQKELGAISEKANKDGFEWDRKVGQYELDPLRRLLTEFEAVFATEAQALDVFSIQQKQAYSMTTLIEHVEEVLPESIRASLSDFTISEIREATKCIAFDLPTAGGFHLLRGLESALRDYYDVLSNGAARPKTKHGKDVPMGDYIVEVERLGAHPKVVSVLKQIKTLHRDPHMHPESVFHMDGAAMLLGVITSAIWMMFKAFVDDESDLSSEDPDDPQVAAASA